MRSVLAVGAYPGDLENGCAGTLAAHRAAGDAVTMLVLTGHQDALGTGSPEHGGGGDARARTLVVFGKLEAGADATAVIENVLSGVDADVVYGPAPDDSDAGRRAVAAATLGAARDGSRVLHYRGPSTLRFEPSVFVDVSEHLERKLATVTDPEATTASARHFGALARVRYAEAFAPTRFIWDL